MPDKVDEFEDKLRKIEAELEEAGASICSEPNGAESWNAINMALRDLRDAIRLAYKMRES